MLRVGVCLLITSPKLEWRAGLRYMSGRVKHRVLFIEINEIKVRRHEFSDWEGLRAARQEGARRY